MAHSGKLRLARQIIREHFGPVTEAVAWTLMTKGRLTLGAVHTLVNAQPGFLSKSRRLELSGTSIPMRSVKEAVFVLMQHNVATYAETVEGNIAGRPPVVYYSVSIDAILDRLQIPAIVHGARHRFGAEAGAALLAVFANGRLSLADLQSKAGASPELADYDMYELHKAFNLLVVKGYLIAVDEYDSMNDADLKISNENSELDSIGPVPTAKSVSAAKRKAAEKAREQYESKAGFGLKRKANDPVPSTSNSKRRKTGPDDAFVDTVDETVFWKVDFDRCSVITRNQQVVNLVRRHLNDTAGAIIAQMLEMVTAQMRHCGEIGELPSVTAFELARNLPSTLSIGMDYGDDPPGFERIVADYLEVMSMDYPNVLTRAQDRGAGSGFTVAFQRAADLIKLQEIERVIDQKLGGPSARIWGMVFQKGKLDDKQVTRLAMISPKETRERLYGLFRAKFLHLQAVPKGADRSAQRTFFLYYTDLKKSAELLLGSVYATVAKLRQRLAHEMSQKGALLQKLQRSDEEGVEGALSEQDRANRERLEKTMDRLEVSQARLSDMIMRLR